MTARNSFLLCLFVAAAATGCNKASEPPKPVSSTSPAATPDKSVAMPTTAQPASDATIPPTAPAGNATVTSQASPSTLSKQQESVAMPMPGQVNNHSVPQPTAPATK